jgi:hypothetical protein
MYRSIWLYVKTAGYTGVPRVRSVRLRLLHLDEIFVTNAASQISPLAPTLLHSPSPLPARYGNESSTDFSISANRRGLLTMKKFNLTLTFMLSVVLTPGLLIAASEVVIGYANISARVSPLWMHKKKGSLPNLA